MYMYIYSYVDLSISFSRITRGAKFDRVRAYNPLYNFKTWICISHEGLL
jgi:hypothetical protein